MILLIVPILLGIIAIVLTMNPKRNYYSQTTLYTGIASGSSVEMDKSFNYLATNNAFDNLIYVIQSRDTQEEVALRLLSQHLTMSSHDNSIISKDAYDKLIELLPEEIKLDLRAIRENVNSVNDDLASDFFKDAQIEETFQLLKEIMESNNSNFVYSILNFDYPYYSLEAISEVKAERISSSDLVKFSYETDDPGICQQTLAIYIDVCIRKYKVLKENGSSAVVEYFEYQLKEAEDKLKRIEQKLLEFNETNNIINFYEQSKAIAVVKEEMSVEYGRKKAELEGSMASAKRLENKLEIQSLIQDKNTSIIDSKKRLGEINYKIAVYEAKESSLTKDSEQLIVLREEAIALQNDIDKDVDEIYSFQNSIEGVPVEKALPDWVDKIVETEDLKAKIEVMGDQNKVIDEQLAMYAPAGANLKRLEREIEVAEQEYIEILHGLNQANLKFQDAQLATNLKTVDPPYFPLQPESSKRKLIVLAVVFLSSFIILTILLLMEFFDDTLKNDEIATNKIGIPALGLLSKVFYSSSELNFSKIQSRLMGFIMENVFRFLNDKKSSEYPKVITVLSMRSLEGKSVLVTNMAKKIKETGKSVLILNHSEGTQTKQSKERFPWLFKFLGYENQSIDYENSFLNVIEDSFDKSEYQEYNVDSSYNNFKSYSDFEGSQKFPKTPDFVLVELPNILETNYPSQLILNSDLVILVCRANRLWEKADKNILNNIKQIAESKIMFVINGVDLDAVENVLGDFRKDKPRSNEILKNLFQFSIWIK